MDQEDKSSNIAECYVKSGPFEKAQHITKEFAISLCEASLFRSLYDDPACAQAALYYLLKDPKLKHQLIN